MSFWNQTQSGTNNILAGRDIIYPDKEDEISIPEFSQIINKFIATEVNCELDFKMIKIKKKNKLNGISSEFYNEIKEDSIFSYDKIEAMVRDPNNENLREEYQLLASYLNQQYLISNLKGKMQRFMFRAICNFDKNITTVKERVWGIRLLNFMYLRCDIGIKC